MEINRFRFTDKSYQRAIKVLKGELPNSKSPVFLKRFKDSITQKNGDLFFKEKKIIKASEVEKTIRALLYDKGSDIPWARDSGFAALSKKYVGISRRKFAIFVSKQRIKRESDNVPPSTKKAGKKLHKKGQIEIDLFFISRKDLPKKLQPVVTSNALVANIQYYVLSMVDKLTGLAFLKFLGRNKNRAHVMKSVREGGKFFSERLDVKSPFFWRDAGTEFAPVSELRGAVQKLGPRVEQLNSHAQRVLHRLFAAKRGGLASCVNQTMKILNNTKSTISKMTPNEAAERSGGELAPLYNKKRAHGEPDKYKTLTVGTKVRVVTKKPKGTFYKAYQKSQWSKRLYRIQKVGRKKPIRYLVNGKWYSRSEIGGPMQEIDQVSEKLLESRTQHGNEKVVKTKEEKKKERIVKKEKAAKAVREDKQSTWVRRSTRRQKKFKPT